MAGEHNPADQVGLGRSISSLSATLLSYVQARGELAAIEAREAGGGLARIALLLGVAVLSLALAWLLLVLAAAFGLEMWTGWPWAAVVAALAGLHLLAAVVALLGVKFGFKCPMFSATVAELQKDKESLKTWTQENRRF